MKINRNTFLSVVSIITLFAFSATAQQLKVPAASPTQTIEQNFALSTIKIEYSRPSVRGRVIYGDLVPFGKTWRTGANSSTKITFGEDVMIEGKAVSAGTYALYTIPNTDNWEIMLYNDLMLGGNVAEYKAENEFLRFNSKPSAIANKVETFTINVADITTNSANIELLWEQTRIAFKVTTDSDSTIMKNIESSLSKDTRPYHQAANYYYANNKDLKKALEWETKAIELNPKAFYMVHLKAKIQLKLKDYKGAIATAEQSIKLAKEAKNDDYVLMNEKLITEAKAGK